MSSAVAWVTTSGVVQGVIMGSTFAYLTTVLLLNAVIRAETTTVNGWSAIRRVGQPGNGILVRSALQKALPMVNVIEEAAYWTADADAAGARLTGRRTYRLHFPSGGLPPTDAFWSLTATDVAGYIIATRDGPSSVGSRTGLATNPDGSVDILLQASRPGGEAASWLATPPGRFKLMLRVYLPGPAIVSGHYQVPPLVEVAR